MFGADNHTTIIKMKSSQQALEATVAATQDRPLAATALASPEEVTLSSAVESSQPDLLVQDQTAVDLANSVPSIIKKHSTAVMKPDIGILGKDFLKNKGREQPIDKKFAIHRRKKKAGAVDVDVGILSNGRRRQASLANLHAMNVGRSLQSEELPKMCPGKYGGTGNIKNLFNETTDSYFPKCSCPSPTTCGPVLCECLELDADGDILQCMDPFNQLCEGTNFIEGIPGPWSMEECLGHKTRAIEYCSMLNCYVEGGSWWQCRCGYWDARCTEFRDTLSCAMSKCCQAQSDDEGRKACLVYGGLYQNYYDQVPSFSVSYDEMISRFNECSFNSDGDKSIVECYCESFIYRQCVNYGIDLPVHCEAMNCCFGETEEDARMDCFTNRFRVGLTGWKFHNARDIIHESCVASGKSSDQCKCDIQGLSNCISGVFNVYDSEGYWQGFEPNCDLFQCCQSQTGDEGRKYCLVQDEVRLRYGECINEWLGSTKDFCYCDRSNMLCTSGHSDARHCELSSCCQKQSDGVGWKECIGNFTTSQPSSAPSASPTAASALPGTSSASTHTPFCSKSLSKATTKTLAAAIIGWVLLT
jgi:hypothetical protein